MLKAADIARQNQFLFCRTALGLHDTHGRNRLLVGPGRDLLLAPGAIRDAGHREADGADRDDADEKQNAARLGRSDGEIQRT